MDVVTADAARLVRDVLDEARRTVGSGPAFAERLQSQGVGPATGLYSQSAVSNWINGRTMPPADVLIAAARIAGISLDARIHAASPPGGAGPREEGETEELQRQIDVLQAQMMEIYGHLGLAWPGSRSTGSTDRREVAG
jgi:transcriptional regulator with XRE-family HTH domain